ncbi:MAG TPA: pitrilysin family protein [Casimicrobiaceae bacterium]
MIGVLLLAAGAVGAMPAAKLQIPPLAFTERVLANGLRVVAAEDHSSPTVSVQVWYDVGSKDDPDGRSGFAHLFEHLMFKGSRYLRAEQFDRLTEDVGGANNAGTGDDSTMYENVVPSNHLERLLWAEAERMANLNVDDANFRSERAVVEEEYRQRVLADPYGRLQNAIDARSYAVHPYRRPGIGNIDELEAASLEDVRAFHRTFYRPDNAVLIVAGDFDPKELDAWVDRYFAPIERPATAIPRVTVVEPARVRDARYTERGPNVPLPAVALTWLAPSARSPDAAALKMVAALLGNGESSRLNQALVYRGQIAQDVSFSADLRVDKGLLVALAVAASGTSLATLERALLAEIDLLATKPVPGAELAKVRTQLLTQALLGRETPLGKAEALGEAILVGGDAQRVNRELDELQAVTPADMQRVVRTYLTGANRVTIEYLQEKPAAKAAPGGTQ